LHAAPGDLNVAFGPKADARLRAGLATADTAQFLVTYNGFDTASRAAFQAAVDIWARTISSSVPIRIRATWTALGPGILGSAGPTALCESPGGVSDTYYAAALADALNGSAYCAALRGNTVEIDALFNSEFSDWDFSTNGTGVPGYYSFMTVVLHEIGHGLGLVGLFTSTDGVGDLAALSEGPKPAMYDRFAVDGNGLALLGIGRPSNTLHAQLTSDDTVFNGPRAKARNAGAQPKLETHDFAAWGVWNDHGWSSGASYLHVDDVLYTGTPNGLMTWTLNSNEVYTDVGPIVKGLLEDQGWTLSDTPTSPEATTLVAPQGSNVSLRPTYTWNVTATATQYALEVRQNGVPVFAQTYAASQACGATTCSATPAQSLAPLSTYSVRVRTWNQSGYGPWSVPLTFTTGAYPPVPTLLAPAGLTTSPAPRYSWTVSAGATTYYLWVQAPGANPVIQRSYAASGICTATLCAVTPRTELTNGTYSWWVQPLRNGTAGPWSAAGTFAVSAQAPGATTLVWPTPGVHGTLVPTYRWSRVAGATWYYLWVDRPGAAPDVRTWYFAGDVCNDTVCSVTPAVQLAAGATYRWFVQTWSSRGYGPWSPGITFQIGTAKPDAATLVAPTGAAIATMPTYVWNRTPGATWYYLWVQADGAAAPIIQTWYRGQEVCRASSTTCSITPGRLLPAGSYHFWIQTYNDRGYGPWSAAAAFSY
jgi:hypothetical protein